MTEELITIEPEMASEMTPVQMDMVLGDERPKIDFSKPAFSYTTARLWRDRPDVAKAALKLLAEPREVMPYRRIMARLHMSHHLLRQLEISSGAQIAAEKKTLGDLAYTATEVFYERAIKEGTDPNSKISAKDAMICAGIGSEKFMDFRGAASIKIEVGHTVNFGSEVKGLYNKIADKLAEMKLATARVVEPEKLTEGESAP